MGITYHGMGWGETENISEDQSISITLYDKHMLIIHIYANPDNNDDGLTSFQWIWKVLIVFDWMLIGIFNLHIGR